MNTFERLCRILEEEFQINPDEITMETTFSEMGLGSLETVDAVMRIEEEFHVEISDEDMDNFHSVSDVCEYLQR